MSYWAVARAVPNHDRLAAECVGLAGYETFVPKIRTRVGAQWRTTPLFVGYFFVRIVDQWRGSERPMGVFNGGKKAATPPRLASPREAEPLATRRPHARIHPHNP